MAIGGLPKIGSQSGSTADLIVDILSEERSLSAKEIYNKIRKSQQISYQAVHKTLKELLSKKVIEKEGMVYWLSAEWIQTIKRTGEILEKKYLGKEDLSALKKNYFTTTFQTVYSYYEFVLEAFNTKYLRNGKIECYGLYDHPPWPYTAAPKEIANFSKLGKETSPFCMINHAYPIDKWVGEAFSKVGYQVVFGVPNMDGMHTYVFGDAVLQIYLAKDITKEIDKFYKLPMNKIQAKFSELINSIYYKKADVNLIMFRNAAVAENLRSNFRNYYPKNLER